MSSRQHRTGLPRGAGSVTTWAVTIEPSFSVARRPYSTRRARRRWAMRRWPYTSRAASSDVTMSPCTETIYQAVYRPDLGGLPRELPGRVLLLRRRHRLRRRDARARRARPAHRVEAPVRRRARLVAGRVRAAGRGSGIVLGVLMAGRRTRIVPRRVPAFERFSAMCRRPSARTNASSQAAPWPPGGEALARPPRVTPAAPAVSRGPGAPASGGTGGVARVADGHGSGLPSCSTSAARFGRSRATRSIAPPTPLPAPLAPGSP